MKNKKGFTLVELLAVIVILGLLLFIGVPTLISNIENRKKEASKKVKELIISAARSYVMDYNIKLPASIPIDELCIYIDCPMVDPYTNEEITGYVTVDENNYYSYRKL